jgi:hypothetical protein
MIYVDDESSWLTRRGSLRRIFEWWNDYWARNLDLVTTAEVAEGRETGSDTYRPAKGVRAVKHVLIFKRR